MRQILRLQIKFDVQFIKTFMLLSNNLSKLMNEFNVDDKILSEKCGVNAATIKKIRLGQSLNPTLESLLPIAKFFDISVSQLIGETSLGEPASKDIPLLLWTDLETKNKESILIRSHVPADIKTPAGCFATSVAIDKYDLPFKKNTIAIVNPKKLPSDNDYILCLFNNQLEICKIIVQFGEKFILGMVPGMQQQIKLESLDNFIGTIIETRNILQSVAIIEETGNLANIKDLLTVIRQKLILN